MYNGYGRNTVPRNELKSIQCHHSVCVHACVPVRVCVCMCEPGGVKGAPMVPCFGSSSSCQPSYLYGLLPQTGVCVV